MEDVSVIDQLLQAALPVALASVAAAVAFGVSKLDKLVKATKTDIDDQLFKAFKEGFEKGTQEVNPGKVGESQHDDTEFLSAQNRSGTSDISG